MKRRESLKTILGGAGVLSGLHPKATALETGLRWSFVRGGEEDITGLTRSDDGLHFVFGSLCTLDPENGAVEWEFDGEDVLGIEHVSHGTVYLRISGGIVALEGATGSERWRAWGSKGLTLDAASVYAVGGGKVTAIERETGSRRWRTSYDGALWKSPTVVADAVLVGTTSGSVQAFEADSGRRRWTFSVPTDDYLRPITRTHEPDDDADGSDGGTAVVWNSTASTVYGVRPKDGTRRWTYRFTADVSWFPGVVTDTRVVLTDENRLRVVDRRTGETRWEFTPPNEASLSPPAVSAENIFVEHTGTVASLSLDGKRNWNASVERTPNSRIGGIGEETMCLYEPDGTILVRSVETGNLRGKYELERDIAVPPLVNGETVYVATEKGALFALDGTQRTLTEFVKDEPEIVGGGLTVTTFLAIAVRHLLDSE